MATAVFEGEQPLYLNFEDPADMMRKQSLVEQEFERRSGEMLPQRSSAAAGMPTANGQSGQSAQSGRAVPNERTAAKLPSDRRALPPQRAGSDPGAARTRGNNASQERFDR